MRHEEARDGHAVWQIVKEACDFSTGAKQDDVVRDYENFKLSSAMPTPEKLSDDLHDLYGLFSKLAGDSGTKSEKALTRKALSLLPSGKGFGA